MIKILLRNIMKFHNEIDASKGIRDEGLIESAVNAPFQTFDGQSLYPTIFDKAAKLFFSLVQNHGKIFAGIVYRHYVKGTRSHISATRLAADKRSGVTQKKPRHNKARLFDWTRKN